MRRDEQNGNSDCHSHEEHPSGKSPAEYDYDGKMGNNTARYLCVCLMGKISCTGFQQRNVWDGICYQENSFANLINSIFLFNIFTQKLFDFGNLLNYFNFLKTFPNNNILDFTYKPLHCLCHPAAYSHPPSQRIPI